MVTKEKKKEIVADLIERFKKANSYFLVDFKGMTVEEAVKIRQEFKKVNVGYKVAKNSLIKRALAELGGTDVPEEKFTGETAIIFGYDDPIEPAKVLKKQFDEFEKPSLKAAMLEGQFYEGSELKTIASLPSKQDVMASIVGALNAPVSGIVGAINGVMRELFYVIEEVAKKQNEAEAS